MMEKDVTSKLLLSIELLSFLYANNYLIKSDILSERFNLSKRSIRRIINDLRSIGYDIESVSGPYGGYRLNKSSLILPINLSDQNKLLWKKLITTIEASDINDKEEVINLLKLISINSNLHQDYNYDVYLTKKLLPEKNKHINYVLDTLNKAMDLKQRVLIKYQSLDKSDTKWNEFRPQQFQIFNQIPYIKGYYDSDSSSFRTLRLSRFIDVKLIDKKYSFNENFDIDNNKSAFSKNIYKTYDVVLKIFKTSHDLLDYEYGDNQSIIEYDDHYILKFTLAGDQIIKELVLNMGKNAILLKPISIVEMIKKEISILNDLYKKE